MTAEYGLPLRALGTNRITTADWQLYPIKAHQKCFVYFQPEVIELHLQMTTAMMACQTAILDLINQCIKELIRCNPSVSKQIQLLLRVA
jgi:hypothetical protein